MLVVHGQHDYHHNEVICFAKQFSRFFFLSIFTLGKSNGEDSVDDDEAEKIFGDHSVNHDDKRTDDLDTAENNETKGIKKNNPFF